MATWKIQRKKIMLYLLLILLTATGIYSCFKPIGILERFDILLSESIIYNQEISQDHERLGVVIIGDRSLNDLQGWPISREYYGILLEDYLASSKAVIIDLLFPNRLSETEDRVFANAMKSHGKVVLAYLDPFDGQTLVYPINELLNSSQAIGYANYQKDIDGFARDYILYDTTDNIFRKSLVYASLEMIGYRFMTSGSNLVLMNEEEEIISSMNIDGNSFFVMPSSAKKIQVYEMSDILMGMYAIDEFDDKIMLVGGSFAGSSDTINMPSGPVIGVHYILNALNTILNGSQPIPLSMPIQLSMMIVGIIGVFLVVQKLKVQYSLIVLVLTLSIVSFVFFELITLKLWTFNVFHLLVFIVLAYVLSIIDKFINSEERIRKMEESLDRILELGRDEKNIQSYEEYIKSLESTHLRAKSIWIEDHVIGSEHSIIRKAYGDETTYKIKILKQTVILPLLNVDDSAIEFVILRYAKKSALSQLKYITSLLVSAHMFFNYLGEYEKKNQLFMNLVNSMISAVDAKDPITGDHSKRVASFSVRIGKLLEYDDKALEELAFAATLHDIGKIGIHDDVLNKPSFFSKEDFEHMKRHPVLGLNILDSIALSENVRAGVSKHHERLDGRGYPLGLSGGDIDEIARIIKIADVYDALTSKRQYKKVWPIERVCNLLYSGRGTEFDERIVNLVIDDIKPDNWSPPDKVTKMKRQLFPEDEIKLKKLLTQIDDMFIHQIMNRRDFFLGELNETFSFDDMGSTETIDFGEHYSKKQWQCQNNVFIDEDINKDIMYYYKKNKGTVEGYLYMFQHGYLTGLVVHSGYGDKKDTFIRSFDQFDEPIYNTPMFSVWDTGRNLIICRELSELDMVYSVVLNKYILQE